MHRLQKLSNLILVSLSKKRHQLIYLCPSEYLHGAQQPLANSYDGGKCAGACYWAGFRKTRQPDDTPVGVEISAKKSVSPKVRQRQRAPKKIGYMALSIWIDIFGHTFFSEGDTRCSHSHSHPRHRQGSAGMAQRLASSIRKKATILVRVEVWQFRPISASPRRRYEFSRLPSAHVGIHVVYFPPHRTGTRRSSAVAFFDVIGTKTLRLRW